MTGKERNDMARENTVLKWTIPVRVDLLGSRLEAYIKCLPTLNALRACHRFGRGRPITTLPAELLLEVEGYLIWDERKKTLSPWADDYACSHNLCDILHHYTEDEITKFRDVTSKWSEDSLLEKIYKYFHADGGTEHMHRHHVRANSWRWRTGPFGPRIISWCRKRGCDCRMWDRLRPCGFFTEQRALVSKHFGIKIELLAAERTESKFPSQPWSSVRRLATMAFLTAPAIVHADTSTSKTQPVPSESTKARLRRTLRLLALEPEMPSEQAFSGFVTNYAAENVGGVTQWPRLTRFKAR